MDSKDRFYVWSECDGPLYWVRHAEIEELASVEDKVDFILGGLGCLEVSRCVAASILLMVRT
jgi:hypothetical protein